jgi:hypothetical protein
MGSYVTKAYNNQNELGHFTKAGSYRFFWGWYDIPPVQ